VARNDVLVSPSRSARLPRWLQSRPFLLAGALTWTNLQRRHRVLLPAAVVLLLVCGWLLTLAAVGRSFEVVAQHPITLFVLLAAGCSGTTALRKTSVYRSLVDSWLAPLAAPSSIAVRMVLVPLLQLVLLSLAVTIPVLAGSLSFTRAVTLWSVVGAAHVAGFIAGWLVPHDKTLGAPDFHYVTIRKPRPGWAQAPRLEPLSYWAMGQARVSTKPKVMAGALVFVLMAFPVDTGGAHSIGGEHAIAIAAGSSVVLYLMSLAVSAVRVAFTAARWLAPTTLRYLQFTVALGYRVLLAQLWTCGWVVLLASATAFRGALHLGLTLTVCCLILSCVAVAGACRVAMRLAGMGGGRGAHGYEH
jgi:hypothetical protein